MRMVAGRQPVYRPSRTLGRYGAVNATALAFDFATLVLLTDLAGVHYLTSTAGGFGLGGKQPLFTVSIAPKG